MFHESFEKHFSWNLMLRTENTFFVLKSKKYCFFLHKAMEKSYLNLHFKFHDFFPSNKEDMTILSLGFFSFRT